MSVNKQLATRIVERFELLDPSEQDGVNWFINKSLWMVSQVHLWHWQTKGYYEHVAIGEFYDGLDDLIDSVAESFVGVKGVIKIDDVPQFTDYDRLKVKETLVQYGNDISDVTEMISDIHAVTVTLDEIARLTSSTLFKLGLTD